MEGLLKQMLDNLFKLHGSFKMFKSLLLKEDGDGASRTSTGKEFQRSGARFEKDTRPARLFARNGRKEFSCPLDSLSLDLKYQHFQIKIQKVFPRSSSCLS